MRFFKIVAKAAIWILLSLLPVIIFFCFELSDKVQQNLFLFGFYLFMANPFYLAGVSYYFINKKSAIFMYLALSLPQILWFIPYFEKNNDSWPMIAEMELAAGIYQIIGITLCFFAACFIKYISFRHRNGVKWFLLCFVPAGCFCFTELLLLFVAGSDIVAIAFLLWFLAEPIYTAIVSYHFISKVKAIYMGIILLASQLIWFIPIGDEWENGLGIYKLTSTAICFSIAYVIKYIVYTKTNKKQRNL